MPPRPRSLDKEQDHEARIRALLAIEIDRVIYDLEIRHPLLVELWGRHRDRGPILDTIFVRWTTLAFADLAELPIDQVVLVDTFYRELDLLRLYVLFTEDMPTHLDEELGRSTRRLRAIADLAIDALGGVPDRPEIHFPDDPPMADLLGTGQEKPQDADAAGADTDAAGADTDAASADTDAASADTDAAAEPPKDEEQTD